MNQFTSLPPLRKVLSAPLVTIVIIIDTIITGVRNTVVTAATRAEPKLKVSRICFVFVPACVFISAFAWSRSFSNEF